MHGKQCRAARGLLGWSQQELADRANVTKKTIADFERGATQPQRNNLRAIKNVFEEEKIHMVSGNGHMCVCLHST